MGRGFFVVYLLGPGLRSSIRIAGSQWVCRKVVILSETGR
jgi:hypothetical protein